MEKIETMRLSYFFDETIKELERKEAEREKTYVLFFREFPKFPHTGTEKELKDIIIKEFEKDQSKDLFFEVRKTRNGICSFFCAHGND